MPHFIQIIMPKAEAVRMAKETDPRTADDLSYAAKAVLGECFGDATLRPYRIIDEEGSLQVVGVSSVVPAEKPDGDRVPSAIRRLEWKAEKGREIWLDIICCPMMNTTDGEKSVAVARALKVTGPKEAFSGWLLEKMRAEHTGCTPVGIPHFVSIDTVPVIRKGRRGRPLSFEVPSVQMMLKVRIDDPAAFDAFLNTGVGRQRGFGFGSMFPREVLDELGL